MFFYHIAGATAWKERHSYRNDIHDTMHTSLTTQLSYLIQGSPPPVGGGPCSLDLYLLADASVGVRVRGKRPTPSPGCVRGALAPLAQGTWPEPTAILVREARRARSRGWAGIPRMNAQKNAGNSSFTEIFDSGFFGMLGTPNRTQCSGGFATPVGG